MTVVVLADAGEGGVESEDGGAETDAVVDEEKVDFLHGGFGEGVGGIFDFERDFEIAGFEIKGAEGENAEELAGAPDEVGGRGDGAVAAAYDEPLAIGRDPLFEGGIEVLGRDVIDLYFMTRLGEYPDDFIACGLFVEKSGTGFPI